MPCRRATRRYGSPRGCADRCRSDRYCVIAASMSASRGLRVRLQQRGRGHDLAGLAVAALRHVVLQPGDLHRMAQPVGRQALDGGDLCLADRADRHLSRTASRRRRYARCRRRTARCRSRISCRSCRPTRASPRAAACRIGVDARDVPLMVSLIMWCALPNAGASIRREHDAGSNAIFPAIGARGIAPLFCHEMSQGTRHGNVRCRLPQGA